MSDEEKTAPPSYDLSKSGQDKLEAEGKARAANPDPNFNPAVNEDDHEPDTSGDPQKFVVTGTPVNEDADAPEVKTELVDTDFYIAQKLDPARKIPGTNPYWDDIERERAEVQRAKIEDREPDLENPPATQGTPYYTEARADYAGLATSHLEPDAVLGVSTVVE